MSSTRLRASGGPELGTYYYYYYYNIVRGDDRIRARLKNSIYYRTIEGLDGSAMSFRRDQMIFYDTGNCNFFSLPAASISIVVHYPPPPSPPASAPHGSSV